MKTNNLNISLIRKYLNGELDSRAMYELERKAQDDPMLMDLLMGMESASETDAQVKLLEIDELIRKRVQVNKARNIINWKTWSAAASLILVFTLVFLWMSRVPKRELLTKQKVVPKKTEQPQLVILPPVKAEPFKGKLVIAKIPKKVSSVPASSVVQPPVKIKMDSTAQMLAAVREHDSQNLNEVVVGYGKQKKAEDIAAKSLAGKVVGVRTDDSQSLAEVVVVRNTPVSTKKNQPVIGWKAYKKYLKENAVSADGTEGTVTLTFTVDSFGRPAHLQIIKGLRDDLDQKAIQLIINGSGWFGDKDDLAKEIKIKIRF